MWEGFRGNQWYSFDDADNTQPNIDKHKSPREERNITTLLNAFWHYIKYRFVESYKKDSDKKTMEIVHSEKFVNEVRNFLLKLDELEKKFLLGDFNNNSLNSLYSRQEFFVEVNNEISKFNEQNTFGITLSEIKDYWVQGGTLRIKANYNNYTFLIDYTEFSGFEAKHPWSL